MAQALKYTVDQMVLDVQRRAQLPNSQALFSANDLIEYLDEELHTTMVPLTMSTRDEYFVTHVDILVVTEQLLYPLPTRAVGSKLRDVVILFDNLVEYNVPRLSPEEISGRGGQNYNQRLGFFLQGDNIGFYPHPNNVNMRLKYFRRPSSLIRRADAAQVVSVDALTNTIVMSNALPIEVITGTLLDINKHQPPFSNIVDDLVVVTNGGTTITVDDSTAFANITVGDWVSIATTAPVAQLPFEAIDVLISSVIAKILISVDDPGSKNAQDVYDMKKRSYVNMISQRVEGEAKAIIGSNSIARTIIRDGNYNQGYTR